MRSSLPVYVFLVIAMLFLHTVPLWLEKSAAFITPGHPELELALVKLYHCTGEKRYLELSKHFIDEHGTHDCERIVYPNSSSCYNQDEIPLRQRETADGHCVRAQYLLCGMADIADIYHDEELMDACRMYSAILLTSVCISPAVRLRLETTNIILRTARRPATTAAAFISPEAN